jgi:hypothetical protein
MSIIVRCQTFIDLTLLLFFFSAILVPFSFDIVPATVELVLIKEAYLIPRITHKRQAKSPLFLPIVKNILLLRTRLNSSIVAPLVFDPETLSEQATPPQERLADGLGHQMADVDRATMLLDFGAPHRFHRPTT